MSYVDFKPPVIEFVTIAFERDYGKHPDCLPYEGDDGIKSALFRNVEMCADKQGEVCWDSIGSSTDKGWLYFSATGKEYGFRFEPEWRLEGSRVNAQLGNGTYLKIPTFSRASNEPKYTNFVRPSYEIVNLEVLEGAALVFPIRENILVHIILALFYFILLYIFKISISKIVYFFENKRFNNQSRHRYLFAIQFF